MQTNNKKRIRGIRGIIFIILCTMNIHIILPILVSASEFQPIMGETIANKEDMLEYYKENTSITYPQEYKESDIDLESFLHIIIEEAQAEGVRADVAFAQILVETDWLQFNGEVSIEQNNFGGLKDQEGNYISFDSIKEGVRANIQILKGYASSDSLNQDKITFLYDLINSKGLITYVEDLGNGNWSEDPEYGKNIEKLIEKIINIKVIETPTTSDLALDTLHGAVELETTAEFEEQQELPEIETSSSLETKLDIASISKSNDITPVEVKVLNIDGSGYVGSKHRIRSSGTSKNGALYQFWIKDLSNNRWTMIQDYSKSGASWTPMKPGKYLYGVHIKDEKSNNSLDAHSYKEVTIKGPEVKTLTIDGSGNIGAAHRIRSLGKSANGVLYQFWVKDLSTNRWTMIQDYSKSSAPWMPTKAGKYLYGVHIKDEKSKARLDTHLYKEVTIKPGEVKTLSIDGPVYAKSTYRIRSLAESANGTLYQFWIKDLSTNRWTMIQDYSRSSARWTPTKPGNYIYGVHIKDRKSTEKLDAHLYKEVIVRPPNVYFYSKYIDTFADFVNKQLSKGQNKIDGSGSTLATRAEIEKYSNPNNTINMMFDPSIARITGNAVNLRKGPSTSYESISLVYKNEIYDILGISNGWYKVNKNGLVGWVSGNYVSEGTDINDSNITVDVYQFLDLTTQVNINVNSLDNYLSAVDRSANKVFEGQAQNFIDASNKYNVNVAYLVAHAMHETGFGSSTLANGTVKVNGQTIYNFFGISAYDGSAIYSGSKYAYDCGWFTQKAAIEGGARWISENYINNSTYNQNTPYKMKWNPQSPATHQYATHVMWPTRIGQYIADLYKLSDEYFLVFEIPKYK